MCLFVCWLVYFCFVVFVRVDILIRRIAGFIFVAFRVSFGNVPGWTFLGCLQENNCLFKDIQT